MNRKPTTPRTRYVRAALALGGALAAAALGAACSSAPTDSTVQGSISAETFASPVKSIIATATDGTKVTATLGAANTFTLTLKAASYSIAAMTADGASTPIAVSQSGTQYATRFTISSGGASVDLGALRYVDGKKSLSNIITKGVPRLNVCLGGLDGTGAACMANDAKTVCQQHGCVGMGMGHGDGDGDGDHHHGFDHHDDANDPPDGADASDASDSDTADGTLTFQSIDGAVILPTHGLKGSIHCKGEDDDDDDDHDGEHADE